MLFFHTHVYEYIVYKTKMTLIETMSCFSCVFLLLRSVKLNNVNIV